MARLLAGRLRRTRHLFHNPLSALNSSVQPDEFFFELAFLYLLVAFGADGQLDEAEVEAIVDHLSARYPDLAPADAREAVAGALAMYLKAEEPRARARQSFALLKQRLPAPGRRLLHEDLHRVAQADGTVTEEEWALLHELAERWEIENTGC